MNDEAGVIVEVEVDPVTAFQVFTEETSAWWHRDRSLFGETGTMRFEPQPDGRLLLDNGTEVGRVQVWEPTPRLVFSYGPGDHERTEVEVRFEATEFGTRVVLTHRGWTPQEDPAGGPWATVLASFARHSLERALLHRLGEFLDAIGEGDIPFFENYLTDDALLIFPGPNNTYTKAECVAVMGDHPPYTKYDIADQRVVQVAGNTAVLTHTATVEQPGWDKPRKIVVGSVLVKVDGSWRLALHQWTPAD
jgi:ketosteroid isomerase-like protein